MNLHELPSESVQAGDGQAVPQGLADGKQPLLPVPFVLAHDVFDIVFVDKEVPVKDGFGASGIFGTLQDLLLVFERDLGVRNDLGKQECVRLAALITENPLYLEQDIFGSVFQVAFVVAIKNQAAFFPTGAFNRMKLYGMNGLVVNILRKSVAIFKENCYHGLVVHSALPVYYGV